MKFRKTVINDALSAAILKVASLLLGLFSAAILARYLGPVQYGRYAIVTAVLTLLAMPLHAGMPGLLVRETVRIVVDKNWPLLHGLRRVVVHWIFFGTLILGLALYVFGFINEDSHSNMRLLWIAFPLVPLMALNSTRAAMLRGLKQIIASRLPEALVQPGVHVTILLLLITLGWLQTETALVSLMTSTLLACIFGQLLLRQQFSRLPRDGLPDYRVMQWFKSLLPFTMLAAMNMVNGQLSTVVLSAVSSPEQVAYLRIADRLAQLVAFSQGIVNLVAAPHIAQFSKQANYARVQSFASSAVRFGMLIAIPIALVLVLQGKHIVEVLFGQQYANPVWAPLLVLCAAQVVNVSCGSVGMILNMSGHERDSLIGIGFGLVVNAVVAIMLAPSMGAVGGAIGVAAGMVIWNITLSFLVYRRLGIILLPWRLRSSD